MNEKDDDVILEISTIPNAGYGVFANRDFKKGETVTIYSGRLVTDYDDHTYVLEIRKNPALYIDGRYPLHIKHLGSFINHCSKNENIRISYDSNPKRNPKKVVKMIAHKNIKKGEELFWDYGSNYWD